MMTHITGINLYIGSSEQINALNTDQKNNCLLVEKDHHGHITRFTYCDPVLGEQTLNKSSLNLAALIQIAATKNRPLHDDQLDLIHLYSDEIAQCMPDTQTQNIIRDEQSIAKDFFEKNPNEHKLSRKESGLSHSYQQSEDNQIIQLAHKQECRVAWCTDVPTQQVFSNLPENTKAAYILVPSETNNTHTLYYMEKDNPTLKEISNLVSIDFFEPFQFNNRGLSKQELSLIKDTYSHTHQADVTHLHGKGGFGRVKKSQVIAPEQADSERATKIQTLKEEKIESVMTGRSGQIEAIKKETAIAFDLGLSDKESHIIKNKAYFHMHVLGTPLSKIIAAYSTEEKIDLAIKLLIKVHQLHTGELSKTNTPYVHRDIKLDNLLVDSQHDIHLIDYGCASTNLSDKNGILCGTLLYSSLDQDLIEQYLPSNEGSSHSTSQEEKLESDYGDDILSEDSMLFSDSFEINNMDSSPINIEAADKKQAWTYHLLNKAECLTRNFLEDDKIASLRTIYCNFQPQKTVSIFDQHSFKTLPNAVQAVFDSTHIAPLLSDDRRQETELFFASVLIFYKMNPNLSESQYETFINELRTNPSQQTEWVQRYQTKTAPSIGPSVPRPEPLAITTPDEHTELDLIANTRYGAKPTEAESTVYTFLKKSLKHLRKQDGSVSPSATDSETDSEKDETKNQGL